MAAVSVQLVNGAIRDLIQIGWIWAVLIPLEVVFPRTHQVSAARRLKGFALGVISWTALGASAAMARALVQLAGFHPLMELPAVPTSALGTALYLIVGTAASILAFDFLYYWFHRVQHTRLLWRFHAVHHAIEDLNAANYAHWTEELSRLPFITIPMALIVPSGLPVWAAAAGLITLQSQYIHAQTRIHFGPFWRIIMDNRFHRIHHSVEPHHHDRNFGVLTPIWDWLFGTLYVPAKGEWPATGLADTPEADGVGDYLWRPFTSTGRSSAQLR